MAKESDFELEYTTYNKANSISVSTKTGDYHLSLIDGACLGVINGLEYEYCDMEKKELLILNFTRDVGLCRTTCYNTPVFFIQKGSTIIFHIFK